MAKRRTYTRWMVQCSMIGAISGDVIGSVFEGAPASLLPKDFPLFIRGSTFTDDTVLTVAVANAIRKGTDYGAAIRRWGRLYPNVGYGPMFSEWLVRENPRPYGSFGNGSAMRVSAVGWAFYDLNIAMREAVRSAEVTHNHPEGIKGAQAVAAAIAAARNGWTKDRIAELLTDRFGYDCSMSFDEVRRRGGVDVTCQSAVPAAAAAFLHSSDFEDAVRTAISLGGDADTTACIAGAIAEAHYGEVPAAIQAEVLGRLDEPLYDEVIAFAEKYGVPVLKKESDPESG